ncbi:hypothetical protein Hanom_Chr04g00319261 [Helianthus anomalus]
MKKVRKGKERPWSACRVRRRQNLPCRKEKKRGACGVDTSSKPSSFIRDRDTAILYMNTTFLSFRRI